MRKLHAALIPTLAVLLAGSPALQAAEPSWVEELGTIDAQIQLLQKREELAEQLQTASQRCLTALPKVVALYQFNGQWGAQLQYPNGHLLAIRQGQEILPGGRVTTLGPAGARASLRCGQQQVQVVLEFATGTQRQVQAAGGTADGSGGDSQPGKGLPVVAAPDIRLDTPLPPVPGTQGRGAR